MYTKQHQRLQLDGISNKYIFVMFFWADGFVFFQESWSTMSGTQVCVVLVMMLPGSFSQSQATQNCDYFWFWRGCKTRCHVRFASHAWSEMSKSAGLDLMSVVCVGRSEDTDTLLHLQIILNSFKLPTKHLDSLFAFTIFTCWIFFIS